jgi:tetratricopeptide (TPR) repeat protein
LAEEGLRVATRADQPFSLIGIQLAFGAVALQQGHFSSAIAAFRTCAELGRTWDIYGWTEGDAGLALALALQGERTHAVRVLGESTTMAQGAGVRLFLTRRMAWRGEAARLCDRPQEAEQLAAGALTVARAQKERGDEAWVLRLLGDLASDRDQFSEAEERYRDALTLAEALGMRPLAAHCHQGQGLLSRRTGGLDRARHELGVARDLYREMAMTVWLERTDAELTELS